MKGGKFTVFFKRFLFLAKSLSFLKNFSNMIDFKIMEVREVLENGGIDDPFRLRRNGSLN